MDGLTKKVTGRMAFNDLQPGAWFKVEQLDTETGKMVPRYLVKQADGVSTDLDTGDRVVVAGLCKCVLCIGVLC